jgi:hypothetical protein
MKVDILEGVYMESRGIKERNLVRYVNSGDGGGVIIVRS